jgi:hypothetical protein
MEKMMKLAALGAMGVAGGVFGLYLLLIYFFMPTVTGGAPGARGGIDHVSWYVLMVAMMVPVAILAGAHVALGKQLLAGRRPMQG